jgi:predicted nicotinamide N-methyase
MNFCLVVNVSIFFGRVDKVLLIGCIFLLEVTFINCDLILLVMKIINNKSSEDKVRVDVVIKTISSLFSSDRHVDAKLDVSCADTMLSQIYHLFVFGNLRWELLSKDLVVLIRYQLNELRIPITKEQDDEE